jgi:hypothetical protein
MGGPVAAALLARTERARALAHPVQTGSPIRDPLGAAPSRRPALRAQALQRVTTAQAVGDPDGELAVAWWAAQQNCLAYAIPDPTTGRASGAVITGGSSPGPVGAA